MSVPYLTDAERPYRPEELRLRFRFFVDVEIRGQVYRRWLQSETDRHAYVILVGASGIVKNIGREEA